MSEVIDSGVWVLPVIFGVYFLAQKLQQHTRILLLNPILVTILVLICLLQMLSVDYEVFKENSRLIEVLLAPAIVALGYPLYQQLGKIRKQLVPVVISQATGCVVGIVSVVFLAKLLGASSKVIYSLAAKSVTTPIAIEVTRTLGGIPSLTASVTITVGIFGAMVGYVSMHWLHVRSPLAQGVAMGTAAHAVGTAKSMEISPGYGAMSSLGLILNGLFTAILAPYILELINLFWTI